MSEVYKHPLVLFEEAEMLEFEPIDFRRGAQSDDRLKLSLDRKVSPGGWHQESNDRWVPTIPNSFGLTAGESCPGQTGFCDGCYALGSENSRGVKALVGHNLRMLQEAEDVTSMSRLLTEMVGRYEREADKAEVSQKDRIFRIHWDGDFFSEDYAKAWADTIQQFPDVLFWTYTRSFVDPVNVVPHLVGIDNLTLYLSTDKFNVNVAHKVAQEYPDVMLALCADDYRRARELARERRSLVCPENIGKLALMDNGRGACVECRWCPDGKVDVMFSKSHVEDSAPQISLFVDATPVELIKRAVSKL